ncbi:uncharacterized protein V1513DRAFT_426410 [Lipomyces chichibuensis]|uniref:uncharacterized protein n=1 Tax=Lipomyces chichibuensis TaxID=1546026 RepID=UPI00334326DA
MHSSLEAGLTYTLRPHRSSSHIESVTPLLVQSPPDEPQKIANIFPVTEMVSTPDSNRHDDSHASQLFNTPVYPYDELAELRQAEQPMDIVEFVNSRKRYAHESSSMIDMAYADLRLELAVEAVTIMDVNDTGIIENDAAVNPDRTDGTVNDDSAKAKQGAEQGEISLTPIGAAGPPEVDDKMNIQPGKNLMARLCSFFYVNTH